MDKRMVMEEVKYDINHILGNITPENMEEAFMQIDEYKKLIRLVMSTSILNMKHDLGDISKEGLENNLVVLKEDGTDPVIDESSENEVSAEGSGTNHEIICTLERKLAGATLKGTDIYIPESVLRKLDFKHGDLIKAVRLRDGSYHYSLHKDYQGNDTSGIEELQFGIVKYNSEISSFVVDRTMYGGDFRIDEVPVVIRLSESDVTDLNIKVDDIVDVSWYKGALDRARVRWVHRDANTYCGVERNDSGKKEVS